MSQSAQWRVFRHLNAAYVLTYLGFGDEYTENNLFGPINEKYKLLTAQEVERIKEVGFQGSSAFQEILVWVLQVIHTESQNVRSEREVLAIVDEVLQLRGTLAQLLHFDEFPMPFSYRHFISFTLLLFLPAYSYSMGYSSKLPKIGAIESVIEFIYVLYFSVACLVTRILARKIHDPFGHDAEDIPVMRFVTSTIAGSYKILCAHSIAKADLNFSESLTEDIFREVCVLKQRRSTQKLKTNVSRSHSLPSRNVHKQKGNKILSNMIVKKSQPKKAGVYEAKFEEKVAKKSPSRQILLRKEESGFT